nr:hypothetical protein [Clostridiales bacterium]
MKKFIAILLAALLVVGMTSAAMAADPADEPSKTFTVNFTGTGKPEETFTFTALTCTGVEQAGYNAA